MTSKSKVSYLATLYCHSLLDDTEMHVLSPLLVL